MAISAWAPRCVAVWQASGCGCGGSTFVRVGNLGEGKVQRQALALQGMLGEWTREAKSQSPMGTKASNEFEG